MKLFSGILVFIKFRIVLLSTLSAATGYIVAYEGFSWRLGLFVMAMFVLAGGAAALNQFQERGKDGLMERTRLRPLPAGEFLPWVALVLVVGLLGVGVGVLLLFFGVLTAGLGMMAVVLYNGMYTYLKRVTAFAAVPGALIGALPPVIGWFAGGGSVQSPVWVGLLVFFYMWQVPHFWLLLGIHAEDYIRAGFPSLTQTFSAAQLARITFVWVVATACMGMLFPLLRMFHHPVSLVVLFLGVVGLCVGAVGLVRSRGVGVMVYRRVFMFINVFAVVIMVTLIIDHGFLVRT